MTPGGRTGKRDERAALVSLHRDFLVSREVLDEALRRFDGWRAHFARFQSSTAAELAVLDQAAAGPIVGSLSPGMTFDPTSGTLDALVNGGRLGLIDDPTLREGLATWLRALEDILENETDIRAGSLRVQIGMEPHGGPFQVPVPGRNVNLNAFPKPTGATLSALKQDAEFMGRARSHQYQMSLYLRELHGMSEILDANLATLDSLISDGGR